jgi:uncharacterized protein (DUF58 family)
MSPRVTPLARSLLTAAAWALALAVLTARPELFLVALPLLAALAGLARPAAAPDYALTHTVAADRLFAGETVAVTVAVTAGTPLPLVELIEPIAPGSCLASGPARAVMGLSAGRTATWSYPVHCPGRGVLELGTVLVRIWDHRGLRAWEAQHMARARVRVYPRIAPLSSLPRPLRTQTSVGDHVSPALGEGIEPGGTRPFSPGDRVKQVNWRASLRLGKLFVNEYHRERNADVVLMLDTLAEAGTPPATTLDLAIEAATSLAAAYLARKDRVGFIDYGGLIHWVRPGTGRLQYERVADGLLRAAVVFTYVAKDLALVPPRVLPPNALIIALTPLLDGRFTKAVIDLAGRGFDVIVLVVSPVGPTRASLPPSLTADLACRLWTLERRAQLDELRGRGLVILEWDPSGPLEAVLVGLGPRRRRLAIAG